MQGNLRDCATALMIAAATTMLGSCSYSYEVRAVAIGGRLAFISTDRNYVCVANINVSTNEEARAAPTAGDDRLLVVNGGAFWWTGNPVIDCTMDYPLLYGAGGPEVRTLVAPKKLEFGVTYQVETEGDGAYGHGCFRISNQRRIENQPYDRCLEIARASMKGLNKAG